jgi:hypothetical protein
MFRPLTLGVLDRRLDVVNRGIEDGSNFQYLRAPDRRERLVASVPFAKLTRHATIASSSSYMLCSAAAHASGSLRSACNPLLHVAMQLRRISGHAHGGFSPAGIGIPRRAAI